MLRKVEEGRRRATIYYKKNAGGKYKSNYLLRKIEEGRRRATIYYKKGREV